MGAHSLEREGTRSQTHGPPPLACPSGQVRPTQLISIM